MAGVNLQHLFTVASVHQLYVLIGEFTSYCRFKELRLGWVEGFGFVPCTVHIGFNDLRFSQTSKYPHFTQCRCTPMVRDLWRRKSE